MEMIDFLNNFYAFIVPVVVGIGSALLWWDARKAKQKKAAEEEKARKKAAEEEARAKNEYTSEIMFKQLQELKTQLILQVAEEVKHATVLAERDKIIENLRINCPDCYQSVMEKIKKDQDGE